MPHHPKQEDHPSEVAAKDHTAEPESPNNAAVADETLEDVAGGRVVGICSTSPKIRADYG